MDGTRARLIQIQQDRGLTNRQMANALGIGRDYWGHIRSGRRRSLSMSVLQRAIAAWPELGGVFMAEALKQRREDDDR